MPNLADLAANGALVQPEAPPLMEPPIEADIIVTLRGNSSQIGIRFSKMKQAKKEYDKLLRALRGRHTITSDFMTAHVKADEIVMVVLVDRIALDKALRLQQAQYQQAQARGE